MLIMYFICPNQSFVLDCVTEYHLKLGNFSGYCWNVISNFKWVSPCLVERRVFFFFLMAPFKESIQWGSGTLFRLTFSPLALLSVCSLERRGEGETGKGGKDSLSSVQRCGERVGEGRHVKEGERKREEREGGLSLCHLCFSLPLFLCFSVSLAPSSAQMLPAPVSDFEVTLDPPPEPRCVNIN